MTKLVILWMALLLALIAFGAATRHGNTVLIDRCGGDAHVASPTWDGGTLVAVRCDDGRRLRR